MKRRRLLYIHIGLSSFVRKDINLLSNSFSLKTSFFNIRSKSNLPLSFAKQFLFLLFNTWRFDGIVIQFAGYHSYLPTVFGKMFGKKVIIVLGGTDTVSFPSIQYGCFYNKKLKYFTHQSLKKASLLLPVSETLVRYNYTYTDDDFSEQGYLFHAPDVKTPFKTVHNGYNADNWIYSEEKETNSFITIAADLGSRFGKKLKGIDLILNVAPSLPNCKFYVVGGSKLQDALPENVIAIDNMDQDKLKAVLANKQFYLQLSMSEGFPNALCEGMLSGCVPIVSNVGAMPEIVGDCGYILKEKKEELLIDLLKSAINSDQRENMRDARSRISENFSLEKRGIKLTELINAHLS